MFKKIMILVVLFLFQSSVQSQERAKFTIQVPEDAKIFVDGVLTTKKGATRVFESPPLKAKESYYYEIKVEVVRDDQHVEEEKIFFKSGDIINKSYFPLMKWMDWKTYPKRDYIIQDLKTHYNKLNSEFMERQAKDMKILLSIRDENGAVAPLSGEEEKYFALEKQAFNLKVSPLQIKASSISGIDYDRLDEDTLRVRIEYIILENEYRFGLGRITNLNSARNYYEYKKENGSWILNKYW